MQVQINSDNSVAVDSELSRLVEADVNRALERFGSRITRVEVHLSDVNGEKAGGDDKRCLMEARPAGHDPVAASDQAKTMEEAARGAAHKLQRLLSSLFGRLDDKA